MIGRLVRHALLRLAGHECPKAEPIPCARAVLCLDCDHIGAWRGDTCGRCGSSGALMPLWSAQLPVATLAEHPRVIRFEGRRRSAR